MTKALFKKQIMEVFSFIYFDRKNSKSRSKGGIIGFAILYLLIFAALGFFFFDIASMLCGPLAEAGFGWLYIALMGLITVTMGVFGSVFSTYSSLYTAKDNDLLLSLPIPSGRILAIRLMGIYLMGLIYELVIAIPTLIVYFMTVKQTALSVVINILIPIVLSFLSPALSCILGFLVALIGSKTRSKNAIIVVLSLVFFGAYYFVCMRAY